MRTEIWNYVSAVMAPKIVAIHQLYKSMSERLSQMERQVQDAVASMQETLTTRLGEIQNTVTTQINNFQTTLNTELQNFRQTLKDAINRSTVDNGVLTASRFAPDVSEYESIQRYTIDRTSITLDMPRLPPGSTAMNEVVLILDTPQSDCLVSLGPGLTYVPSNTDGPLILKGQTYRYSIFIVSEREAFVTTTLWKSPDA